MRLIKQSSERLQKQKSDEEQRMLSLSNQAQYLLVNKATVRWLKSKITDISFTDDIDSLVDRFRGNLIIDTSQELIEREWQKVVIGKHEFKVTALIIKRNKNNDYNNQRKMYKSQSHC